jgi:cation:H+ antiporter
MLLDGTLFLIGLGLLVVGGDLLVRGASDFARRIGVAPIVIGMTVVAFGTSAPELVVNLAAAWRGNTAIGFGNVVGSNIANVGLLLGLSAVIAPLTLQRTIVNREIPMMILGSTVALVLALTGAGRGAPGFGRGDGVVLLLLFSVFLYYTFADALRQREDAFLAAALTDTERRFKPTGPGKRVITLLVLGGLAILVAGAELTVRGASALAHGFGISETVIGLTVVAIGTSLPELATAMVAARQGKSDIAIGNIVGSNIFNILLIWGISVTIHPAALAPGAIVDLFVMTVFALLLLPMAVSRSRIGRTEGAIMLSAYFGYMGWLAFG